MVPSLPTELYALIARYAIESVQDSTHFTRPSFKCISGFGRASPLFREIVQALKDETLVVLVLDFPGSQKSDSEARRVWYLEINAKDGRDCFRYIREERLRASFFKRLASFSTVTTLSLSAPGLLLTVLERLQSLPLAHTLQCLDIRADLRPWVIDHEFQQKELTSICLPSLLHLRISSESWHSVKLVDEDFVRAVASFLNGCRKLKLLSFGVALDDEDQWEQQNETHEESFVRMEPWCGYGEDIKECLLCSEEYDHEMVADRESAMTHLLAEKLPNLAEVRWLDLWARNPKSETSKHVRRIRRLGSSVIVAGDAWYN